MAARGCTWSVQTRSKFSTLSWLLQLGLKGDFTCAACRPAETVPLRAGDLASRPQQAFDAQSTVHQQACLCQ